MGDIVQLDQGVTAMRYGSAEGRWDKRALIRVAAFVTGVDIEGNTLTQDQVLDVVRPVETFWKPDQNVADIEVITGKRILGMTLGQWLVKYPSGLYRVLSNNDYLSQVGPAQPALSFRKELEHLLNKHSKDVETNTADDILAETVERFVQLLGINNAQARQRGFV